MVENKLNKKYYVWIWLGLIFASLFKNVYSIYLSIAELQTMEGPSTAKANAVYIIRLILQSGVEPVLICLLAIFAIYIIAFRRYVRCVSRADFCYSTMAMMACVYMIEGIINIFGFLSPVVYYVGSTMYGVVLHFAGFMVLYFCVFVKKYNFNPVEKYRAFLYWVLIYTIILGVYTFMLNFSVIAMFSYGTNESVQQILQELGMDIVIEDVDFYTSIAAICVYVVDLAVTIGISIKLKKNADLYRDPRTREDFVRENTNPFGYDVRQDAERTYDDNFAKNADNKSDKVFDEFDI